MRAAPRTSKGSDANRSAGAVAGAAPKRRAASGEQYRWRVAMFGQRSDEGCSLQDRLACIQTGQVPLTANERILVLSEVARGLAFLHSEAKVIHRDVKVIHRDNFRTIPLFPF